MGNYIMDIETYTQKLKRMDWYYAMSDDFSVYSSGRNRMDELKSARKELDPDCEIWNQYAPSGFKVEKQQ